MAHHYVSPGDTIQISAGGPSDVTPADITNFLMSRGWVEVSPTSEDRWDHIDKNRRGLRWEQAMACEFYEFVTLGGR